MPVLLDLCCGAGGAAVGYARAGFDVVGVDIKSQPLYPFEFYQGDALDFVRAHGEDFDVIHASPPCQGWSRATKQWRKNGRKYPNLIERLRGAMHESVAVYVIENVEGAPLIEPLMLCGAMFGLRVYRHRFFECSFPIGMPQHPEHKEPQCKMGRPPKQGEFIQPVGHFSGVQYARDAMGIQWMGQKDLAQAIPPAYTEYIGRQIRQMEVQCTK